MSSEIYYDVALSFSRAQRDEARALAAILKEFGFIVFYDEEELVTTWGKHLPEYLLDVYSKRSRVSVLFVSATYAASVWTTHERRAVLSRALRETSEYILPIRFDDTELPGISSDIASLEWTNSEDVARKLTNKLIELARKDESIEPERLFSLEGTLKRLRNVEGRMIRYNILVLGRAGVGKSSLINYLFGKPLRPVGVGDSITPPGFHPQDEILQDIPVSIFDSEGITVENVEAWRKRLDDELEKRSSSAPIENWFHTILYCIGAGGSRIDPVDVTVLRLLLQSSHQIILIFTKADQVSHKDLDELRESILIQLASKISTLSICSTGREISPGIVIPQFGATELQAVILKRFWETIEIRLPKRCLHLLDLAIDEWATHQKSRIDDTVGFLSSRGREYETIYLEFENLKQQLKSKTIPAVIKDEIGHAANGFSAIAKMFGIKISNDALTLDSLSLDGLNSAQIVDDMFGGNTFYEILAHIIGPLALPIPIPLPAVALPFRGAMLRDALRKSVDKLATSIKEKLATFEQQLSVQVGKALPRLES